MRRSVAALASALVLLGCDPPPKLGEPCKQAEKEVCGTGNALVCRAGVWQEWGSGCRPTCLQTNMRYGGKTFAVCRGRAHVGGPCPTGREGLERCSDDGAARVVCRAGTWQIQNACACSDREDRKKLFIRCGNGPETLAE